MARRPRLLLPGALYHVMARGNRKAAIFFDDQDRKDFLRIIAHAATYYALRIFALCLMNNHYHLLLDTPEQNLSEAMQYVNGGYAKRSNRRYRQTGHLFEARFRSLVIQRESYLIRAARYIVRNPVRAGLVAEAGAWPWSTYRATAGLETAPPWLQVDWIRWAFKTDSLDEARQRYVAYVNAPAKSQPAIALTGIVLGSRRFKERLMEAHQSSGQPRLYLSQNLRSDNRPTLPELFVHLPRSGPSRDRAIYVARAEHGYRFGQIASFLGIDRTTASKAAQRFLDKLDNSESTAG